MLDIGGGGASGAGLVDEPIEERSEWNRRLGTLALSGAAAVSALVLALALGGGRVPASVVRGGGFAPPGSPRLRPARIVGFDGPFGAGLARRIGATPRSRGRSAPTRRDRRWDSGGPTGVARRTGTRWTDGSRGPGTAPGGGSGTDPVTWRTARRQTGAAVPGAVPAVADRRRRTGGGDRRWRRRDGGGTGGGGTRRWRWRRRWTAVAAWRWRREGPPTTACPGQSAEHNPHGGPPSKLGLTPAHGQGLGARVTSQQSKPEARAQALTARGSPDA